MISRTLSPLLGIYLLSVAPRVADSAGNSAGLILCFGWLCCMVIFVAVPIVGMYKVFEKAGQPGWHAIIPVLNSIVIAHIVGREWWWGLVPYLNLVPLFELSKAFGKDAGFGVGLILLAPIFICILGFGDAQFQLERRPPLF